MGNRNDCQVCGGVIVKIDPPGIGDDVGKWDINVQSVPAPVEYTTEDLHVCGACAERFGL